MADWAEEETDKIYADDRNFYKLEKWTKDGSKIDSLSLRRQQSRKGAHPSREGHQASTQNNIRLTIRQRTRVLDQYPK